MGTGYSKHVVEHFAISIYMCNFIKCFIDSSQRDVRHFVLINFRIQIPIHMHIMYSKCKKICAVQLFVCAKIRNVYVYTPRYINGGNLLYDWFNVEFIEKFAKLCRAYEFVCSVLSTFLKQTIWFMCAHTSYETNSLAHSMQRIEMHSKLIINVFNMRNDSEKKWQQIHIQCGIAALIGVLNF